MTRRLTLAIVGVVAVTFVVAGLASYVLTQATARRATEAQLVRQAEGLAELTDGFVRGAGPRPERRPLGLLLERSGDPCNIAILQRVLEVQSAACVVVEPAGAVAAERGEALPAGLPDRLDVDRLDAGDVVSGHDGGRVWAATSVVSLPDDGHLVAVLTNDVTSRLQPVQRWLLLAAAIAVAVGAGVAVVLGRRLTRPVIAAEHATARLAAGDLDVRLDTGPGDDELARLSQSVNQLAESLQRSRALEQRFLLSVSHDLRTPLTSIRGYAEALGDGTLGDVGWGAGVIEREANRLERLVGDLLDLAKLEAREFRFEPRAMDLRDTAVASVEAFAADAARAQLRLVALAPDPVPVVADPDRFRQVAANLVENALRYASSLVQVAAGSDAAGAWLTVTDDGPGIAAEDLAHVFERLYVARSDPRRRESGSGLGLAITRELVTGQGGTIHAEQATPRGTRFVVRFPSAPAGEASGVEDDAASGGRRVAGGGRGAAGGLSRSPAAPPEREPHRPTSGW